MRLLHVHGDSYSHQTFAARYNASNLPTQFVPARIAASEGETTMPDRA